MGRHTHPDPPIGATPRQPPPAAAGRRVRADDRPEGLLGWGAFATAVASVLAGWTGRGWTSALPVIALGAAATAALWLAARATRRPRRRADTRRDGRFRE